MCYAWHALIHINNCVINLIILIISSINKMKHIFPFYRGGAEYLENCQKPRPPRNQSLFIQSLLGDMVRRGGRRLSTGSHHHFKSCSCALRFLVGCKVEGFTQPWRHLELISDFIKLTLVTHFVEMLSTSTKERKFARHSGSCPQPHTRNWAKRTTVNLNLGYTVSSRLLWAAESDPCACAYTNTHTHTHAHPHNTNTHTHMFGSSVTHT